MTGGKGMQGRRTHPLPDLGAPDPPAGARAARGGAGWQRWRSAVRRVVESSRADREAGRSAGGAHCGSMDRIARRADTAQRQQRRRKAICIGEGHNRRTTASRALLSAFHASPAAGAACRGRARPRARLPAPRRPSRCVCPGNPDSGTPSAPRAARRTAPPAPRARHNLPRRCVKCTRPAPPSRPRGTACIAPRHIAPRGLPLRRAPARYCAPPLRDTLS